MLYFERGSKTDIITAEDTRAILKQVFDAPSLPGRKPCAS